MRLISALAATTIFLLWAEQTVSAQTTPDDDQRILDEITVTSQAPTDDAPVTGTFLVRPLLIAHRRKEISSIESVELVFAPVDVRQDGISYLFTDQDRERFRITVFVPQGTGSTRIRESLDAYGTEVLELPGGTYVLSEVHYNTSVFESGQNPGDFGAARNRRERVSYCLSEGTLAFDIHNGETGFLGQLVIASIGDNPARWRDHYPVEMLDPSLSGISGSYSRDDSVVNLDLGALAFDPESGLCPSTSYQVAAWKSNAS